MKDVTLAQAIKDFTKNGERSYSVNYNTDKETGWLCPVCVTTGTDGSIAFQSGNIGAIRFTHDTKSTYLNNYLQHNGERFNIH